MLAVRLVSNWQQSKDSARAAIGTPQARLWQPLWGILAPLGH